MFSGIHAVSNRGDHWAKEADLRMANKRERAIAEGRPGRLLRTRPFLRASMEGKESPQLDAYEQPGIPGDREYWADRVIGAETTQDPITSEQARVINGAADAAAGSLTEAYTATPATATSRSPPMPTTTSVIRAASRPARRSNRPPTVCGRCCRS